MENPNTPDPLDWKIIDNWGVSMYQDLMLLDRMTLEIITSNTARLSVSKLRDRIEILMKIKSRLIEDWEHGHKQM